MKRILSIFIMVLALSACASPARNLIDAQIRDLSDDQLCSYQNNYRSEARVDAEIEARGLNCNRFYRECLRAGNQPNTQAMEFCVDTLRENERLRYDRPYYDEFGVFGYGGYNRTGIGTGFRF